MKMSNELSKKDKGDALTQLAMRLNADPQKLKSTLVNTVMKAKDRQVTESEFLSFIIVSNSYKLNPITKEIYAFPDKKGGIVPIVSTDGWSKLMTTHPDYKMHKYIYSENMVEMEPSAKKCSDWIECVIVKKDGGEIAVREYLDECYRKRGSYDSPWQTHTKRMLRHKAKIQAARDVFGFGGIYDQDEGERIIESQVVPIEHAELEMPQAKKIKEKKVEEPQQAAEKEDLPEQKTITKNQLNNIRGMIKSLNSDRPLENEICADNGIDKLDDLQVSKVSEVMNFLAAKMDGKA